MKVALILFLHWTAVQHERAPRCYQYSRHSSPEKPGASPPLKEEPIQFPPGISFNHDPRLSSFTPVTPGHPDYISRLHPQQPMPSARTCWTDVLVNPFLNSLLVADRAFDPRQLNTATTVEQGGFGSQVEAGRSWTSVTSYPGTRVKINQNQTTYHSSTETKPHYLLFLIASDVLNLVGNWTIFFSYHFTA